MALVIPIEDGPARTATVDRAADALLSFIEHAAALVLAADVLVVAASVIWRYALHAPLDWSEEVASGLMSTMIFLGAATAIGRARHIGIELVIDRLPSGWRPAIAAFAAWLTVMVSAVLLYGTYGLLLDTQGQTTSTGLPSWWFQAPILVGVAAMVGFSLLHALKPPLRVALPALFLCLALGAMLYGWNTWFEDQAPSPLVMLIFGAVTGIMLGVPIAFALALGAMLYFLLDPSLPMLIWAQQVSSGADHFVLLAIPFFVLAGLTMEVNGMSSRLIELLLRMMGRMRGGLNIIVILATMLFSGVSGSKLADIAAVGGVIMPAVRKTRLDENETAGLLACTAVMAETIPPCVNLIIFAFVSNISVGGLFMAGLVPAGLMAIGLIAVAVLTGRRVDLEAVFAETPRRPLLRLTGGALLTLAMILMIGRGVATGIATSTEISAFAVIYALAIGAIVFRELSPRATVAVFVKSAAMTGSILFIVAAASSLSYALTIERIPDEISVVLTALGHRIGATGLVLICVAIMFFFGMILEGAPALILFGPLLTPIAMGVGVNPLQFGIIMVVAMGLGFFAPPIGVGLFVTNAMTGTRMANVVRPMAKYLAVLAVALFALILVPGFSLWLPRHLGMAL
jgi:tripartite ATP-independent transporter DctM subunit